MSTTLSLFIALSMLVIGIVATLNGMKIAKFIRGILAERRQKKLKAEVQSDIDATKDKKFTTTDGKVEGHVKDHEIVWIRVKGGTKRDSFEELFSKDSMPKSTHKELLELQERLELANKVRRDETYNPSYYRVIATHHELGRDLVIYRPGGIRLTDRLIVNVDKAPNEEMEILGAFISHTSLDHTSSLHELDFVVTERNPQDQVNVYLDIWEDYLTNDKFAQEAEEVAAMQDNLEFYNNTMRDGQVKIVGDRAYIRGIRPVVATKTQEEEQIEEAEDDKRVRDIIKNAIDARRTVSSK